MRISFLFISLFSTILLFPQISLSQFRNVTEISQWKFIKADPENAFSQDFDDTSWEKVTVPHDWAIYGPFDKEIDKQVVQITQNNEEVATEKTGRTGALPFVGTGWYRTKISLDQNSIGKKILLTFDGAMSNAEVYVNGVKVGNWAYGYSYFYFDISEFIYPGELNTIAVRLENLPFSSRWYPGAGLYRKVQLIIKEKESFKHWGHYITTPFISDGIAQVKIKSRVNGKNYRIRTIIKDEQENVVASDIFSKQYGDVIEQDLTIQQAKLWNPKSPHLYTAEISLFQNNEWKDYEMVRFGVRKIEYTPEKGFLLNGESTKFKGVCLHHDLGPLGIAINKAALKRQLIILKDMGVNAIRSAHNMPSLEQLELCDELGFLFVAESFDEWKKPKVKNGYNLYFDEWVEKDLTNLIHATRNHPSIVMWSAGNEVPDQWGNEGVKRLKYIQDLFHREDPTRPVTVGMDQVGNTMKNGFGAILDIPGLNYRTHLYDEAFERFPQGFILGSETASTVSSRGVYKFPVKQGANMVYDDLQSSSYDLEHCSWSNIPEDDFVLQDDKPWVLGEFVWTGFDYLGEPTPYDEYWPSRSSYFGICDLAGIPKDRYYLYRSRWNTEDETVHILPHWNWEGKEGDSIPVFVYTNYPKAELFLNGKSMGVREKDHSEKLERYRLMWMEVPYEPGELKVVTYDDNDIQGPEKSIITADTAYQILVEPDRIVLEADGKDLSFLTVSILDKDGNFCPLAQNRLNFQITGAGKFKAVCNGDATSLEPFHIPSMKVFNGKLVFIVQSKKEEGVIRIKVSGEQLQPKILSLNSKLSKDNSK